MIHKQEHAQADSPRWYAYCTCGVCGPLRADPREAQFDDYQHQQVCSTTQARKEAA